MSALSAAVGREGNKTDLVFVAKALHLMLPVFFVALMACDGGQARHAPWSVGPRSPRTQGTYGKPSVWNRQAMAELSIQTTLGLGGKRTLPVKG